MFFSEKLDQYTTLLHLLCIVGCPVLDRVNLLSAVHQLEERHVVLGLQRDVVEAMNLVFERKRSQKVQPRRIGGGRCRVGAPTRRDCGHPPHLSRKKIGRLSKLVL